MKSLVFTSVTIALLLTSRIFGQNIADPLVDFLARYSRDPGDKVYRLICDIDNDGNLDVFLAYTHDAERDGDCAWTLYLKRNGKYIDAPALDSNGNSDSTSSPWFNIHRYVVGIIPELRKWGLLTSEINTGRNNGGQLKAIIIEGNTFKMVDVGNFKTYTGATPSPAATPTPSRFPSSPTPAIEELNP